MRLYSSFGDINYLRLRIIFRYTFVVEIILSTVSCHLLYTSFKACMIILINGYICEGSSDSFTYPYSFSLIYYVIGISGELSFHLLYTSFKACMIIFMKGDMCEVSLDPFNCPYSFSLIFLNIILEQDMVMFYTF